MSVNGSSRSSHSKNSDLEVLKIVDRTPKKTVEKSLKSPLSSNGTAIKKEKLEKLRTVHEKQMQKSPYSCSTCLKRVTSKKNLKKHYRIVHKRKSFYVCQNCLTGYPSRNALFDHKRVGSCKQNGKKNVATFERL